MSSSSNSKDGGVLRIPPYSYIHLLDTNTNVTSIEVGPQTLVRHQHQKIVAGPTQMVRIPPRHYCVIENPALKDAEGVVKRDQYNMVKLRYSEREVRVHKDWPEPFPLYPGEQLYEPVTSMTIVQANTALKIRCVLDHKDPNTGEQRVCGSEYLFTGPGTFVPSVDSEVIDTIQAVVVKPDSALKLRALRDMADASGTQRVTGEEWIYDRVGAYIPGVYEEIVEVVNATVLTEKVALHLVAKRNFVDVRGKDRKTGDEWLVTASDTNVHLPDIHEDVKGIVRVTTLSSSQHCYVLNPVDPATGVNQRGARKLVRGECTFFLKPGERLDGEGIKNNYVLGEDEGLLLYATQAFTDVDGKQHAAGTRWMVRGPQEYVPQVETEVLEERRAIVLDTNEGVYVRDIRSGNVRALIGQTYMLSENEVLYEKLLEPSIEKLVMSSRDPIADRNAGRKQKHEEVQARDKTRVVTLRVPHNSVVQIYDFKQKKSRIVFGPELVMLGPDEQFTQISLSGSKPKRPNEIRTLVLLLGPDFMTDIIQVETMDHARLQIQLAYNWFFNTRDLNEADAGCLFSVPDFVGDSCKAVASNVRGAVASVSFDHFHTNSKDIIRKAVFGVDKDGNANTSDLVFPANRLHITSVDIQSVEPVDQRTRDALQKSVQLAIEITTSSQEATAKHEAQRQEQAARGRLDRQKISDEAAAEKDRRQLLELQAMSSAVESQGQAKAEANSRAEAALIEAQAELAQVKIKAEAQKIEADAELKRVQAAREAELAYIQEQNRLEEARLTALATIEARKFTDMVQAIGSESLVKMAQAGPDAQAKLLGGLGITSTIITDGNSPINLFNTAKGLVDTAGAVNAPTK